MLSTFGSRGVIAVAPPSSRRGGGAQVQLYAELQPQSLLPFLIASQGYSLEPALAACQQRGLVTEQARRPHPPALHIELSEPYLCQGNVMCAMGNGSKQTVPSSHISAAQRPTVSADQGPLAFI